MIKHISPVSHKLHADQLLEQCDKLLATAADEDRDLTAEEQERFDRTLAQVDNVRKRANTGASQPVDAPEQWRDGEGRPVYALKPHHRFADLANAHATDDVYGSFRGDIGGGDLSLGRIIRAQATGDWSKFASRELKALGENSNSGGGILVPSEISRNVIDLARAQSAVIRAGAVTIPMQSDFMTLARIKTDPTMQVKTENAAFTGSDPVFDGVGVSAYLLGTYVTLSRELAADAPNIEQVVERVLANALAAEIDRQAVRGSGSQEMLGLVTNSTISETGSVGAIAMEDLVTCWSTIAAQNYMPNSYILHPTIYSDLNSIASGDGSTSQKGWVPAPSHIAPLTPVVSTNITTANVIMGQFDQMAIGLRQEVMLEATTTGGDAFTKHQLLIKAVWRGGVAVLRDEAFHRLAGVTT